MLVSFEEGQETLHHHKLVPADVCTVLQVNWGVEFSR